MKNVDITLPPTAAITSSEAESTSANVVAGSAAWAR